MPAHPCEPGCTCGIHRGVKGSGRKPCPPGCNCDLHHRTPQHNARIAISVRLTQEANRRLGRPINQHG